MQTEHVPSRPHQPAGPSHPPPPSGIGRFAEWASARENRGFADYDELWRWSVGDVARFWEAVWEYYGIRSHAPYESVLVSAEMPGASWFPGARLNYAEHVLGDEDAPERVAIIARSQTVGPVEMTFGELRDAVARARTGLRRLGVGPGDRVAAYLPNIPETVVALLATASLGAIWTSCAPEFGTRGIVDRFAQVDPEVLLVVSGYHHGTKAIDRRQEVARIRAGLPSVRHVVHVPYGSEPLPDTMAWDELLVDSEPLTFVPVPFDHPLWILFSSGTTGLPKPIVHGHGGILLEQLKVHDLSFDVRPGDRFLWFTTTAWTMWNTLVSALLRRAAIVLFDGNPLWPDLGAQWELVLPQGRPPAGRAVRPVPPASARRHRFAPARRGVRLDPRTVRRRRHAQLDQRWNGCVRRVPGGQPLAGRGAG